MMEAFRTVAFVALIGLLSPLMLLGFFASLVWTGLAVGYEGGDRLAEWAAE